MPTYYDHNPWHMLSLIAMIPDSEGLKSLIPLPSDAAVDVFLRCIPLVSSTTPVN